MPPPTGYWHFLKAPRTSTWLAKHFSWLWRHWRLPNKKASRLHATLMPTGQCYSMATKGKRVPFNDKSQLKTADFLCDPHCSSSPGADPNRLFLLFHQLLTRGQAIALRSANCPIHGVPIPLMQHEIKTVILAFLKGIPNFDLSFASHHHLNATCPKRKPPQLHLRLLS